jgi:hypothetical protein
VTMRSPEGWRGRLALADLRWIWLVVIALSIYGAYVLLWPRYQQTVEALCRQEYAGDRTAADSSRTDGVRPLVQDPKFVDRGVSCGVLRQAGKL